MYLYFDDNNSLVSTCSNDNATFIIDGKECSTSVEYKEFDDSHGYELKKGKVIDLGEIEQPPSAFESA